MSGEEREDLIRTLEEMPERMRAAVAAGASLRDADGGWSVAEIVAHVRASDAILSGRVFQVLVREGLPLPGFDERAWGDLYAAAAIPLGDQVAHFTLRRAELVAVLRSLTAGQWLRSGEHEEAGTLSVADICQRIVDHEAEHRAQLDGIAAGGSDA